MQSACGQCGSCQGLFNMTSTTRSFSRLLNNSNAERFLSGRGQSRWKKGEELVFAAVSGPDDLDQFDHRANSVRVNPKNTHNPYLSEKVSETQHTDPGFFPQTQYWVPASDVEPIVPQARGWTIAFRRIARSTDVRTLIAAIIPQVGCGDPLPVLLPSEAELDSRAAACLLANLNSFSLDYISRQKVQATHLDWYTAEQLPVIAPTDYARSIRRDDRPRPRP